jgi:prepilin-type N-terminal cleavage/methylation domain-containing protein
MAAFHQERRRDGFTLLELLIAIAILALLIVIAYSAIVQGLRVQSSQEAATTTQARLRRVVEVFTQEMRSAVLGAVSDNPYASDSQTVSFTLLDGGAGFQVESIDVASNRIEVISSNPADLGSANDQMMVVDAGGSAAIFTLASNPQGSAPVFQLVPTGNGCFSGMSAFDTALSNRNALVFRVKTIGLRYDSASETLFMTEGAEEELPLAFDLAGFTLSYVYREGDGTLHVLDAPLRVGGDPARNAMIGGNAVELVRLQVELEGSGQAVAGEVSRKYVGQVELASNQTFSIKAVSSCS